MIEWYSDKDLAIYFDRVPMVGVRYPLPSMTKAEKKAMARYPFINKIELKVKLYDVKSGKVYNFTIPKDYFESTIFDRDWKNLSTKELDNMINHAETAHLAVFIRNLSDEDLKLLLSKSKSGSASSPYLLLTKKS